MAKHKLNFTLLLVLLLGLLTAQWATIHIHPAANHSHDGSHHAHVTESHSHFPSLASSHYVEAVDTASNSHDHNTISIDQPYIPSLLDKLKKQKSVSITPGFSWPASINSEPETYSTINNSKLSYLSYATKQPRGPPLTS